MPLSSIWSLRRPTPNYARGNSAPTILALRKIEAQQIIRRLVKQAAWALSRTSPPSDAPPPSLALLGSSRLFKIAHLDRHLRYPERKPRGPPGASKKRLLMRRGAEASSGAEGNPNWRPSWTEGIQLSNPGEQDSLCTILRGTPKGAEWRI
jgi:hypothetical protein